FTAGDIRDVPKLWSLLHGVDFVYHLAARVSVPESVLYPVEYNAINVGGTVSLLTAMRDAQIKRLVFASSGAVYGEQPSQPLTEELMPHPATPYAVSKRASELYVQAIGQLWGIETVILRIFNAYGPGQPLPPSHPPVVPHYLRQALTGASVVIHGDGRQTRDFVFISDVADALVAAAQAVGVDREILNIGSGVETSVGGLADTIAKVLGKELHRLGNGDAAAGVSRMVADVGRAHELLGYKPRVSLPEGLREILNSDARFARR
ncbi:MAG: NAD-dependent epimerase/dehydratase family protein, partial [Chloroflexi bacterium]|nr:NAD-dependent epimerase/dehydratase family protein [Chloroflexota bacterium]